MNDQATTYAALAAEFAERLAAAVTATDDRIHRAAEELRAGLPDEPEPREVTRLHRLVAAFDLSPFERDLIVLAGLPNEHEIIASTLAQLHPRQAAAATPALAMSLLCSRPAERAAVRRSLIDSPLITAGILRLGSGPFFGRSIELAEGLWETLRGFDTWPDSLRTADVPLLVGLQAWRQQPDVTLVSAALEAASIPTTVVVTAADLDDARTRAGMLIRWTSHCARELHGELGDHAVAQLASLLCAVRGEIPLVNATDLDAGADPLPTFPGSVVIYRQPNVAVTSRQRPLVTVRVVAADLRQRAELWSALLPQQPEVAKNLAALHRVDPLRAAEAAGDASALMLLGGAPTADPSANSITQAVLARALNRLPSSVHLVRPSATEESLVLNQRSRDVLDTAVERARYQVRVLQEWGLERGRRGAGGVRMLFTGPPGTGKTYTAEVLAARLGLDLLVVDLAGLVSKWLGETEKNLAEVFDAAERTQAVLFFDEADAIFARRTETSDAHARWANLETAYLLGRIEEFDGVTILASNLRSNIDTAFLRRLEFVMPFEEPDQAAREQLWREHLKAPAPLDADVNPALLAELYPVTGGVIRNAALAAAFLAAADEQTITADHVFTAIQREYEKAGRSFPGRPRSRITV
jgi:SpoVK/Ycf46/Vps4 family AAA+-type ATPase